MAADHTVWKTIERTEESLSPCHNTINMQEEALKDVLCSNNSSNNKLFLRDAQTFCVKLRQEMFDFAAAFLNIAMFLGDFYNELICKNSCNVCQANRQTCFHHSCCDTNISQTFSESQ